MNGQFLARLEGVLQLYGEGHDPDFPVLCFDERPCFLIGDTVKGFGMETGRVKKENYAYSKHGSCAVLAAIEPLTGKRIAHVRKQRTKREFALFMEEVARNYPGAKKIRVVLDNLNTHSYGAFYDTFEAGTAAHLAGKIEFVFTPKSASWLNMIEIEFSALSRQCLDRRIPCMKELEKEVLTFFSIRTAKKIKINWQFTKEQARKTLNKRYVKVNQSNLKYKPT